jgi:hypothetical protein
MEVPDWPALRDRLLERRILDRFAGAEGVGLEVEESDPDASQQGVHATLHDQREQRPAVAMLGCGRQPALGDREPTSPGREAERPGERRPPDPGSGIPIGRLREARPAEAQT